MDNLPPFSASEKAKHCVALGHIMSISPKSKLITTKYNLRKIPKSNAYGRETAISV